MDRVPFYRRPLASPFRAGLLCCLAVGAGVSAVQADSSGHELDWVPWEQLTESQRRALPSGCCGTYIAPRRDDEDADRKPEDAPTRASADRSEGVREESFALEGDVRMTQGYRSFRSDRAHYDERSGTATLEGNIEIREPGVLLRADKAQMDVDSGDADLENARFVIYETRIRGDARRLEKLGDHFIGLSDSELTSCEPDSNAWMLKGQQINVYSEEHYGTARHARIELFQVPVFYTPYIRFPVGDHRQTGFLFPSVSYGRRNGLEVSTPFYWNIAPNLDATITPDYMSRRGTSWDLETRHLSRHFETEFSGAYLSTDRGGFSRRLERQIAEGEITEEEAYPHRGESRWQYNVTQHGGRGERWTTEIDYTDLSDDDYLRDLGGGLDVDRTSEVAKMGRASYQGDQWLFGIKGEELRGLSRAQYPHRELPRIHANGRYQWGDWVLGLDNEYTYFDINSTYQNDNQVFIDNLLVGERFRTDYSLTWDKDWVWGFFKPRAMVKTLSYQLDDDNLVDGANSNPSLAVPQGSLDMGLYFERDGELFGRGFLQTLEPRVFYFYSDFADHSELFGLTANNRPLNFDTKSPTFGYNQLYRTSRFTGGDRIDDAHQVSLGVTSRFIDPLTGAENLNLSLGQIFYFEDRRVGLSSPDLEYDESDPPEEAFGRSELAAQVGARLGERMSFNGTATYNEFESRMGSASASLRYADEDDRIVSLRYRFSHRPPSPGLENPDREEDRSLDQVDLAFHLPVYGQWSLIGRANYDFTYEEELDTFLGLEYNDCCYRFRILARRWLDFDYTPSFLETVESGDYDQSIIFDFQLKGLGSINRRVTDLLEQAIPGYGVRDGRF